MTSREKFEQAIKSRFGDLIDYRVCKNSDGEYMAWDMQVAWWAWQAAETDLAVQLANAESKCRELAAENAALKELIEQHANSVAVCPNCSHEEPSETDDIVALYRSMETPSTDAFLAEVRSSAKADGVQEYADSFRHAASKHRELHGETIRVKALLHEAENADKFAAQLRKGAAL